VHTLIDLFVPNTDSPHYGARLLVEAAVLAALIVIELLFLWFAGLRTWGRAIWFWSVLAALGAAAYVIGIHLLGVVIPAHQSIVWGMWLGFLCWCAWFFLIALTALVFWVFVPEADSKPSAA